MLNRFSENISMLNRPTVSTYNLLRNYYNADYCNFMTRVIMWKNPNLSREELKQKIDSVRIFFVKLEPQRKNYIFFNHFVGFFHSLSIVLFWQSFWFGFFWQNDSFALSNEQSVKLPTIDKITNYKLLQD